MPPCPICKSEAATLDKLGDATGYDCEQHGRFRVVDTIFATADIDRPRAQWEAALKRAKDRQPDAWAPLITSDDF
jgi:hypothetical protein